MRGKILFVEDELQICQLIERHLSKHIPTYDILIAKDGQEGLNLFNQHKKGLNIVIIDKNLPKISGSKLISIIRQQNKILPIVLSSGDPSLNNEMELYKQQGLLYLLQKPYSIRTLVDIINKYVI